MNHLITMQCSAGKTSSYASTQTTNPKACRDRVYPLRPMAFPMALVCDDPLEHDQEFKVLTLLSNFPIAPYLEFVGHTGKFHPKRLAQRIQLPDRVGHPQRSCAHASLGQSCFWRHKGKLHNIREVVLMTVTNYLVIIANGITFSMNKQ